MDPFKTYDVRGLVPDEIDASLMYAAGRAAVLLLNCPELVLGRDARVTSEELARAFADGAADQGCTVKDAGVLSTSELYALGRSAPACAMVTASHNPKEYNGLKLCSAGAVPVYAETGLLRLRDLVRSGGFPVPLHRGMIEHVERDGAYALRSWNLARAGRVLQRTWKVLVDCGNGVGGAMFRELARDVQGLSVDLLFGEPDGSFPNHEANPAM
ncbi:MAG: phosphomannomutase/phosphoglucomutase, partial [Nitrosarchaeum sp.]|nr:phosphomannomutase/phosphoglucomutase [Nitrosarchaeum sp.]